MKVIKLNHSKGVSGGCISYISGISNAGGNIDGAISIYAISSAGDIFSSCGKSSVHGISSHCSELFISLSCSKFNSIGGGFVSANVCDSSSISGKASGIYS